MGLELEKEVKIAQPIFPNLTLNKLLFKDFIQKKNCIKKISFLNMSNVRQVLYYF